MTKLVLVLRSSHVRVTISYVKKYPTMHYTGIPSHIQSLIPDKILIESFLEIQPEMAF